MVLLLNNKNINKLGFGSWQLGNLLWGTMAKAESINLVRQAVHAGVEVFDTAPGYANGLSESYLGEALYGLREKVFLSSKFGHWANDTTNFTKDLILPSLQASLARLKTHYLDALLLHNPSLAILRNEEGHFDELEKIRLKGLIHGYGASIDRVDEIEAILTNQNIQVIELLYNVFFQAPRTYLDKIASRKIKLIIKVPLDSGWLTGKYNAQATFEGIRSRWSPEVIARRGALVTELKSQFKTDILTPYALRFLYSYQAITAIIPGIKSHKQLTELLAIPQAPLSTQARLFLENFYDEKIHPHPLPW